MIYTYWEGPKPDWIKLCLRTAVKNIPNLTLLTPENLFEHIQITHPVVLESFQKQRPNVKSDFIRAWLLQFKGAMWVDADAVVFRDLKELHHSLPENMFLAYRAKRPSGREELCTAIVASKGENKIARKYFTLQRKLLLKNVVLGRIALGPNILSRAIRTTYNAPIKYIPPELVHPIHWFGKQQFRKTYTSFPKQINREAYCYMMTHRTLMGMRQHSEERLLSGDEFICHLFRYALGIS